MPTQILTRFADKRIVLDNSYIARQFDVGVWTRLRIGMRMSIMGPAMAVGFPHLTIGLCSGAVNVYPNDCHFAGVQTNNSSPFGMQTTYVSGFSGTGAATRHRLIQKVGSVETYGADSNNTAGQNSLGGTTYSNNCHLHGLEIEKTAGTSWTFRPFTWNVSSSAGYYNEDFAMAAMEVAYGAMGAVSGHNYQRTAEVLTVDEGANGALDTINVAWDRSPQTVEILGIYVCRLP